MSSRHKRLAEHEEVSGNRIVVRCGKIPAPRRNTSKCFAVWKSKRATSACTGAPLETIGNELLPPGDRAAETTPL
jgi:hypothetical protein